MLGQKGVPRVARGRAAVKGANGVIKTRCPRKFSLIQMTVHCQSQTYSVHVNL